MESKIIQKGDGRLEIEATVRRFSEGFVRAGIIDGMQAHPESALTMGELASIHEFGAPAAGIPARSFIWLGTQQSKERLKKTMRVLGGKIARKELTSQAALRILGELMQKGMREVFQDNDWEPLAPGTVARKGHAQPLIDSRALYEAIDFEVQMPGERK
jgi:hypothetical protein